MINKSFPALFIIIISFTLCKKSTENKKIEYYENGKKKLEVPLKNGKKEGRFNKYYNNGSIKMQGKYVNDSLHGKITFFYPSGKVKKVENWEMGVKDGYEVNLYKDEKGKIESKILFKDNKKKKGIYYYKNGVIGLKNYYDEDGRIVGRKIYNKKGERKKDIQRVEFSPKTDTFYVGDTVGKKVFIANKLFNSTEFFTIDLDSISTTYMDSENKKKHRFKDDLSIQFMYKNHRDNLLPRLNDSIGYFRKIFKKKGKDTIEGVAFDMKVPPKDKKGEEPIIGYKIVFQKVFYIKDSTENKVQ